MSFTGLGIAGGGLAQTFAIATAANPGVTPGTIIVGADTWGYHISYDSGDHWTTQNKGVGASTNYRQCAAILWSTTESSTIYAGTGNYGAGSTAGAGLLVSNNGAGTWARRTSATKFAGNHAGNKVTANNYPRPAGRLLVQDPQYLFAATYQDGIMRSATNGSDGFPVVCQMNGVAPVAGNYFPYCLVPDPSTATTLYAGTYDWDGTGAHGRLWKCTNAHAATPNFNQLTGAPATILDLVILAGTLYAVCSKAGLYRSVDGGTTWVQLNGNTTYPSFIDTTASIWNTIDGYVDSATSNHVVVLACSNGVKPSGYSHYASAIKVMIPPSGTAGATFTHMTAVNGCQNATIPPDGRTWWNAGTGLALGGAGFVNPCIRFDPNDSTHQRIFVSASMGMYRSYNGGTTWTVANNGMAGFLAHPLALDPNDPNHLLTGDSDWGCFDISDAIALNGTTTNNDSPLSSSQTYSLAIDPVDGTCYAGNTGSNQKYTNNAGDVFWRPKTQPTNWTALKLNTPTGGKTAIGLCALRDAANNKVLIAAVWGSGLWRNVTASGAWTSWTQVSTTALASATVSPGNACLFAASQTAAGHVYCFDRNSGIYRSTDYGVTWTLIRSDSTTSSTANGGISLNPTAAAGVDDLWYTSAGLYHIPAAQTGATPTRNTIATLANFGSVAVDASGRIVCTVTDTGSGSGLVRSSDGGTTWADIVKDDSFSRTMPSPEQLQIAADGRIYVSGSNIVTQGYPATVGPTRPAAATFKVTAKLFARQGTWTSFGPIKPKLVVGATHFGPPAATFAASVKLAPVAKQTQSFSAVTFRTTALLKLSQILPQASAPATSTIVIASSNPSFESGVSPWTSLNGGVMTQSGDWSADGTKSLKLTGTVGQSSPGTLSELIAVLANYRYMIDPIYFYTPHGWPQVRVQLRWYDSSFNQLNFTAFDFESGGTSNWSILIGGAVSSSTIWSSSGTKSLLLTANGAAAPEASSQRTSPGIPITAGHKALVTADISARSTGLPNTYLGIRWYNSSGVLINEVDCTDTALDVNEQQTFTVTGTAPAATSWLAVSFGDHNVDPNGAQICIDNVRVDIDPVYMDDSVLPGDIHALTATGVAPSTSAWARIAVSMIGFPTQPLFTAAIPPPKPPPPGSPAINVGVCLDPTTYGYQSSDLGAALTKWASVVGKSRPPTCRRQFYVGPPADLSDFTSDIAVNRRVLVSFSPPVSLSQVQRSRIDTFLLMARNAKLDLKVALWPELALRTMSTSQYVAMLNYYGPTVRKYYPLVFCVAGATVATQWSQVLASWPGNSGADEVGIDIFCNDWLAGATLDQLATLADGASPRKPVSIWELGANPLHKNPTESQAQIQSFFAYVQTWLLHRWTKGRPIGDVSWTNFPGTLTAFSSYCIPSSKDPIAGYYRSFYDAITAVVG